MIIITHTWWLTDLWSIITWLVLLSSWWLRQCMKNHTYICTMHGNSRKSSKIQSYTYLAVTIVKLRNFTSEIGLRNIQLIHILVNSLWRSDAIWRQRSGSTLARVMACCLTTPSHYLNQCWLIISEVQWHSYWGNSIRDASTINH